MTKVTVVRWKSADFYETFQFRIDLNKAENLKSFFEGYYLLADFEELKYRSCCIEPVEVLQLKYLTNTKSLIRR
jgi:hypothetical protein